jgi:hypothetical protein
MRANRTFGATLLAASAMALASDASASPIDNPGNAIFVFYDNPGSPFIEFANNDEISSYDALGSGSDFTAAVNSAGTMSYTFHGMVYHETSLTFGGDTVYAQLDIDHVTGTTDLSGPDPDVDWTINARLRFRHGPTGGGDFGELDCSTEYFDIDVTGDWGDTTSSPFTIPALDGGMGQDCANDYFVLNFLFDLGSSGALLHLYKFQAYNLSTMDPLEGS